MPERERVEEVDRDVESLLRKYLWVLDSLVVAAVAICSARATSAGLAASLLGHTSPVERRRAPPPPPEHPTAYDKTDDFIVQRNIFCSHCPPPGAVPDAGAAVDPGPQKTTLPLKLMAIMYAPTPEGLRWTTAVIGDTERAIVGPFRVGDTVHAATILDIGQTRVYLDHDGRTEFLDLVEPSTEHPAAPVPPVVAATPAPAAPAASPAPKPVVALSAQFSSVRGDRIPHHRH